LRPVPAQDVGRITPIPKGPQLLPCISARLVGKIKAYKYAPVPRQHRGTVHDAVVTPSRAAERPFRQPQSLPDLLDGFARKRLHPSVPDQRLQQGPADRMWVVANK